MAHLSSHWYFILMRWCQSDSIQIVLNFTKLKIIYDLKNICLKIFNKFTFSLKNIISVKWSPLPTVDGENTIGTSIVVRAATTSVSVIFRSIQKLYRFELNTWKSISSFSGFSSLIINFEHLYKQKAVNLNVEHREKNGFILSNFCF